MKSNFQIIKFSLSLINKANRKKACFKLEVKNSNRSMMEVAALNKLRKRSGRARPTRESLKSFMPKRCLASSSRENNRDKLKD